MFLESVGVPRRILYLNELVSVAGIVMFGSVIDFVVSISWGIKFTLVQYISKHTKCNIAKSLKQICVNYDKQGLEVYS